MVLIKIIINDAVHSTNNVTTLVMEAFLNSNNFLIDKLITETKTDLESSSCPVLN